MKQRYEYKEVEVGSQVQRGIGAIQEMAEDGWQFVGALGVKGTTDHLIFERPVEREASK